jgi:hypothetical protein
MSLNSMLKDTLVVYSSDSQDASKTISGWRQNVAFGRFDSDRQVNY